MTEDVRENAVLVTGGAGFLGAHLVRDLLRRGSPVVVLDVDSDGGFLGELLDRRDSDGLTFVAGDVTDGDEILRVGRAHSIRRVVHLAAMVTRACDRDVRRAVRSNIDGAVNVFEMGRALSIEKIAWASSLAVFGPRSRDHLDRIGHDSAYDPADVYGASKVFVEVAARHYARAHGLDITGVRLGAVYGYGKHLTYSRGTAVDWFRELFDKPALNAGPSVVPGADLMIDFQYVDDAVQALRCALEAPAGGGETFTAHGDLRSLGDAAAFVQALLPDTELSFEAAAEADPGPAVYDATTAETMIGYAREFTMERGIETYINTLRRNAGLSPLRSDKREVQSCPR